MCINPYGEKYFFVRLGEQWPHDPSRRLIHETTSKRELGRVFKDGEEAREVLAMAAQRVVDEEGRCGWHLEEV